MIRSSGGGLPCIQPSAIGSLDAASGNGAVWAMAAELMRVNANAIRIIVPPHEDCVPTGMFVTPSHRKVRYNHSPCAPAVVPVRSLLAPHPVKASQPQDPSSDYP